MFRRRVTIRGSRLRVEEVPAIHYVSCVFSLRGSGIARFASFEVSVPYLLTLRGLRLEVLVVSAVDRAPYIVSLRGST